MAGSRQPSSLPPKMPKVKAAKSVTATKPSLSTEFVVDSDDSGDARAVTGTKLASETAKSNSNISKTGKLKSSTSQEKKSKKRKSPSPSSAKDDSSASESENNSSNQNEKSPPMKRILAAQDGSPKPKLKPAAARPVLTKRSINPSTNVKPLDQEKERGLGADRNKSNSEAARSSEDTSSGSESGSESGSGNESKSGSSDQASLQNPRKRSPVRKGVPQQRTPTYEPPAGFKSSSISLHPASQPSEIFAPSNLQGKQIWHITAPESIPISLAKEVSTQDIGNGACVLEYHGAKYGLVPESEAEQTSSHALLLPSAETNDYRPSKTAIVKTLHLQQFISLSSHAVEPAADLKRSASASESYKKTPRQQPEGLRMRYRPFGVSDDSSSESPSEPIPKAPEFRIPAPVKATSPARKRKRPESNDDSSNTASAVKSKKRKEIHYATAGAIEDVMDVDSIQDKRSNGVEKSTKSPNPGINGVKMKGSLPNGNETKEERRRNAKDEPSRQRPMPATALPLDVKQHPKTTQPGEVVDNVPTNTVTEGTSTTNNSPRKDSKDDKAKRREKGRRRKEMERASRGASLVSAEVIPQREVVDGKDQIMQEMETAHRQASIQLDTPKDKSPQKQSRTLHELQNPTLDSSQVSQRQKTKEEKAKRMEEKAKRREEKGRRKMESGSV